MLELARVSAGYGQAQALFEVSLALQRGEVGVLAGRNGAGKSTMLKAIMGLVRPFAGEVRFDGRRIEALEPFEIARLGLGYVPEERRIFAGLTVDENLAVGRRPPRSGLPPWTAERLFELFPNLAGMRSRPGSRMSGGEQKMLAIARTLMGNPTAILLDEPSEGIAPVIVRQMADAVRRLKSAGMSVLLCEQNRRFADQVADRAWRIEKGRVIAE
ncbi:MAG TPA: ABC transporter ATP-binding protein [Burkholderiales bacterium]|nr:ABC transporter ATP-binding protein [Burkholderiales bacterium]